LTPKELASFCLETAEIRMARGFPPRLAENFTRVWREMDAKTDARQGLEQARRVT
jgi:hypothetical protein